MKKHVKLQIFDTSGQERFRTITSSYYRGCDAVIVCFDVSNPLSIERIKKWFQEIDRYAAQGVVVWMCACKNDLAPEVSEEAIRSFASTIGVPFSATSAKDGVGVEKLFAGLASKVISAPAFAVSAVRQGLDIDSLSLEQITSPDKNGE